MTRGNTRGGRGRHPGGRGRHPGSRGGRGTSQILQTSGQFTHEITSASLEANGASIIYRIQVKPLPDFEEKGQSTLVNQDIASNVKQGMHDWARKNAFAASEGVFEVTFMQGKKARKAGKNGPWIVESYEH